MHWWGIMTLSMKPDSAADAMTIRADATESPKMRKGLYSLDGKVKYEQDCRT